MSDNGRECECHKIDWSDGPGNYKLLSTGENLKYSGSSGHCCQTKCNDGVISMDDYLKICQYIPGEPGTRFPQQVYLMMIADRIGVSVSECE